MKGLKKAFLLLMMLLTVTTGFAGCGDVHYVAYSTTPYQEVIYGGRVLYTVLHIYPYSTETDIYAQFGDGTRVIYTVSGDMTITSTTETVSIVYDHLSDGSVQGPYLISNHGSTYNWGYLLLQTTYI